MKNTIKYINERNEKARLEEIRKKEELNNYKVRPLADEAVLYEGYCVLPKERTRTVEMVADLKRDEKGNPILDEKTGKFAGIELRPRTEKEIQESPDKYIPKRKMDANKYLTENNTKICITCSKLYKEKNIYWY